MSGDKQDWWGLAETISAGETSFAEPIHAPEGREQAERLAEEYCRTRGVYAPEGERPSRQILRVSPTNWHVVVRRTVVDGNRVRYGTGHMRVTIAPMTGMVEGDVVEPKKRSLFKRG